MAIVTTDNKHYKAIADKVREIKGTEETMTPSEMPSKVQEVYEKGKSEGGGDSWYDTFWDNYQNNGESGVAGTYGKRTIFDKAFSGYGWYDANFSPKYNMKPLRCSLTFQTSHITNLEELLQEQGRSIDTSDCEDFQQIFQDCRSTHLPKIDARNATTLSYAFSSRYLVSIRELVVSETTPFSNAFNAASNLVYMYVTGTIGQNRFDVSNSTKLDKESLMSIINALKDFTGTGETRTVTLGATNLAKLTDAEKAIATQKGWTLA